MKKLICTLALVIISLAINAQTNWQKGGNNNTPFGQPSSIGTSTTWNAPLNIITNGIERLNISGGGTGFNAGRTAIGNNLLGFVPQDRLHLYHDAASNVRMRFTYTGLPNGLGSTIGINNTGQYVFTQFENQAMIFETNGATERFRITEDDRIIAFRRASLFFPNIPPVNYPAYISKFEIDDRTNDNLMLFRTFGGGQKVNGSPGALNFGAIPGALDQNYTLAEFIQKDIAAGDAGVRLQGSRRNCIRCDIAFIDLAQWDNSDPTSNLFNMGRIASGQQENDTRRGYVRLYTNDGSGTNATSSDVGLKERMRINAQGIGFFNMIPENANSNDPANTARFNILDNTRPQLRLVFDVNAGTNISNVFTNLQTTSDGDLFIEPRDERDANPQRFTGIHTALPQNTLEINSTAASPNTGDISGTSGLRFTDMVAGTNTKINPGSGVLSVDEDGDIIYVPGGSGGTAAAENGLSVSGGKVVLGQIPGQAGNPGKLLNNREIPMDGLEVDFNNGFVNVNKQAGDINTAGLNVRQGPSTNTAINAISSNVTNPVAITATSSSTGGGSSPIGILVNSSSDAGNCFGIVSNAISTTTLSVIGVDGFASRNNITAGADGTGAIGVRGIALNSAQLSVGVQGLAYGNSQESYGVYGWARNGTTSNYSVFGHAPGLVGEAAPNGYAGYFDARVFINGDLTGPTNITYISDQNFKTNVDTISNSLSILQKLHPKQFYFDTINNHGFNFNSKKQYGFLAQQVDTVLHELVSTQIKPAKYDSLGNVIDPEFEYKTLNYNAFIAILTDAAKEQQTQIENQQTQLEEKDSLITDLTSTVNDLNARLTQLENCLSALLPTLCEMNQSAVQQTPQEVQRQLAERIQITLSDKNTLVLSQNVPNPFAEKTVIAYNIPANVQKAQIHFYNAEGKIINSVDLNERGNGELTVFANDLSSGIYTYTLVADGKIVATKKMMKN